MGKYKQLAELAKQTFEQEGVCQITGSYKQYRENCNGYCFVGAIVQSIIGTGNFPSMNQLVAHDIIRMRIPEVTWNDVDQLILWNDKFKVDWKKIYSDLLENDERYEQV